MTDWKESLSGSEKPKSEASKVCGGVLEDGDGVVSARGSVVYGSDVEGDGVGGP